MRGLLTRNPIGWLQQYSWSARLVKWGWCLGIVLLECVLVTDRSLSNVWDGQYLLASLLILGVAFTASGSFREECQTGAMELLLVTPLKVPQKHSGGRLNIPDNMVNVAWVYYGQTATRWELE